MRAATNFEAVAKLEAHMFELPVVGHQARAEVAVIDYLLAERERLAFAAVRLSPPDCIVNEPGERPADPSRCQAWDRAVRGIEGYRQQHGIEDRDNALGAEPKPGAERACWQRCQHELRPAQRVLGLDQARTPTLHLGIGL